MSPHTRTRWLALTVRGFAAVWAQGESETSSKGTKAESSQLQFAQYGAETKPQPAPSLVKENRDRYPRTPFLCCTDAEWAANSVQEWACCSEHRCLCARAWTCTGRQRGAGKLGSGGDSSFHTFVSSFLVWTWMRIVLYCLLLFRMRVSSFKLEKELVSYCIYVLQNTYNRGRILLYITLSSKSLVLRPCLERPHIVSFCL